MGIKQKFLISAFIITFLYGSYYWGIPAIVDLPSKKDFIESKIKNDFGYNVSLNNPNLKMGILPSIMLKADSVSILNDDNSEAFAIESPAVNIKLLPLLIKHLNITRFNADSFKMNLSLDKASKLKLGQYVIPEVKDKDFKVRVNGVNIQDYTINFNDELRKKDFTYSGNYFNLDEFIENKHIKFSADSMLTVNSKSSKFSISIDSKLPFNKIDENQLYVHADISDFDLSNFSEYAAYFSKGEIKSVSGVINLKTDTKETEDAHKNILTNLTIDNLAVMNKDIAKSVYCNNKLEVSSNVNTIKNGLHINYTKILTKDLDMDVKGDIKKITSKVPDLAINVKINKSRTESFIPLMPGEEDLVPDVNLYLLKKHFFYGDIEGELDINGNAVTPDIYGQINVTNGYLEQPIKNASKGADIKLGFKKDILRLDVTVPTGPKDKVFVYGDVELYGEKLADLYIKSTPNVELKTAQIVLNPLHRILKFVIGPVPVMDIYGIGDIDLHVTGNKKKPHAFGEFNFKNATVSFLDIHNMVVKNGDGSLKFNDLKTYFENYSGTLNGKPIKIKGACDLYGVLDFHVLTDGQDLNDLLTVITTSPMLKDIQPLIAPIKSASGASNFKLNLYGTVPDVNDMVFNKNLFARGSVDLLSDDIILAGLSKPVTETTGVVNFDNTNVDMKLTSQVNNSKLFIDAKMNDKIGSFNISSDKFSAGDAILLVDDVIKLPFKKDLATINTSFKALYSGPIDEIKLDKVTLNGKIYSNAESESLIVVPDGTFSLNNGNIRISPLKGTFNSVPYTMNLNVSDAFDTKRRINGDFRIKKFNFDTLSLLKNEAILPENILKELSNIKDIEGSADITALINNNNLRVFTKPYDISFVYEPAHMKIKLVSGDVFVKNDTLYVNKLNSYLGEMPVLLDGKVGRIFKKPYFDMYINAKPTQEFFDQFFNNRALYPVKTKGDILLSSKVSGFSDNIHTKTELKVAENSSIYYMGASLGGADRVVKIMLDSNLTPLRYKINNFEYSNMIQSQNNKSFEMLMLNATGAVRMIDENNVVFENVRIKTQNPTDAKIFNILFRKPFMKQGLFTSDLIINGNIMNPSVRGMLDFTSIDVPFYDSTIKDIHLDFKQDDIYLKSKSVVLTNDIDFSAKMKNDLKPPFVLKDVKLQLADLNVDLITKMIRDLELDYQRNHQVAKNTLPVSASQPMDMSQIMIKDAQIAADTIKVKNINAQDFVATLSLNEKMLLDVDKFKFNIANGQVNGDMKYNLLTNVMNLSLDLKDADALMMSEALFDLKGQVYGNVTGDINLTCNGKNQETCTKTLYGDGKFVIKQGKMPKLGSLEYLLKAGNLINGGIRGLSINGIIDLITPLKTGEFDDISGNIAIHSGLIDTINIYSSGRDLNMYMTGSYNLINTIADMNIYGNLSKNMTTVFGKIKNASLNTLLNTIPFMNNTEIDHDVRVEIEKIPNTNVDSNASRIFAVEIYGDINGEDYVKSFKWVK